MPSVAVNPPSIAPTVANFHHGVVSDAAGRILHTSGVVPVRPDGTVPDTTADQASVVWANIAAILAEAQMAMDDIVSMVTYVVPGADMAGVMAARDAALDGHMAASTLVTVAALARPEWKVEVAVVAIS